MLVINESCFVLKCLPTNWDLKSLSSSCCFHTLLFPFLLLAKFLPCMKTFLSVLHRVAQAGATLIATGILTEGKNVLADLYHRIQIHGCNTTENLLRSILEDVSVCVYKSFRMLTDWLILFDLILLYGLLYWKINWTINSSNKQNFKVYCYLPTFVFLLGLYKLQV